LLRTGNDMGIQGGNTREQPKAPIAISVAERTIFESSQFSQKYI